MEIRGVWMSVTDSQVFRSKENITEAIAFLADTGFNVVFPVVWSKGYTLYPSRILSKTLGVEIDPQYSNRDPLAELVEAAQRVGIAVIPWFEYGFASSYRSNGGRILEKKPEWKAYDRAGNLLSKNGFEWMNAFHPEVQDFMMQLVLEVANNYAIAGIQGDDRFPAFPIEGGYDRITATRYRQQFDREPPSNYQDRQWLQWRADLLTEYLSQLYRNVKAIDSNLLVSLSPNIYRWCLDEYLQDSQEWLNRGLADLMHPQVYRRDWQSYRHIVKGMVKRQYDPQQLTRIAPGILIKLGKYRISAEYLLKAIAYHRACGIQGEVLFFYEGLREDSDALGKALRSQPYADPAPFPSAADLTQLALKNKNKSREWEISDWWDWLQNRL